MSADQFTMQAQLDALNRRRQMAEALAQQTGQPQQQQVVNGRVMDQGFAPAIRGIASLLAQGRASTADRQATQLQGQLGREKQAQADKAMQALMGGPPQQEQPEPAYTGPMSATPAAPAQSWDLPQQPQQSLPPTMSKPMDSFLPNLAKAQAALRAGVPAPIVDAFLKNNAAENKPETQADYTIGDTRYSGKSNQPIATNPSNSEKSAPALVQEYEYSKAQGFKGTFMDWKKASGAQGQPLFGGQEGDLLASLAIQGVSLPAGLRSKEQQHSLLTGLLRKYPDMNTDELATKIHNGQISFGAEKKETTTAATLAGKTAVGENELVDFIPKALAANKEVSRGSFVPFTKLQQLGEKNISDPKLKALYGRTQAILNAYDIVAARGGTDQDKRAHNRQMLETADSPETYEVAANILEDEAKIAKGAARKATLSFDEQNKLEQAPKAVHWNDMK